jgi:hypothetical protein
MPWRPFLVALTARAVECLELNHIPRFNPRARMGPDKKEEAIAALPTQRNIEDAAKHVDISAKTLLRLLKVPEFAAAYRETFADGSGT